MKGRILVERIKNMTFKNRIIVIFLISSLIPFLCLGLISLFAIDSILGNKVETAIQSNLKQDVLVLENTLNNLNHVAQQLAFGGGPSKLVGELQQLQGAFERIMLRRHIVDELKVVSFTNPNIGLLLYYFPASDTYDFETSTLRRDFSPERLPVISEKSEIIIYGPHKSFNSSFDRYVFSTMRKVNLPDQQIYVYIETSRDAVPTLFAPQDREPSSRQLLILDDAGRVIFSQDSDKFPENSVFPEFRQGTASGTHGEYFWSQETSEQGWSIVSMILTKELNRERDRWVVQMTGFFLISLLIAIMMAWVLWKMVYKPLDKFNTEIKSLIQTKEMEHTDLTNIPEFDSLLHQIRRMRGEIWELYGEIKRKEKRKADLEVEKLLYQINPHFLMNTLDTAHWLAMMNGQQEIDKLLTSLNKLLSYNLGKMGEATTIGDEVNALKEYLQLQQIRYDFEFDVDLDVDEKALSLTIPRFILQPLVENALYHGVSDDGYIHVNIQLHENLEITIQDNGMGMPQEKIDLLLYGDAMKTEKVGMGIGMGYVRRILESHYGERASFQIKSEVGKGTTVRLRLPVMGGGKMNDSRVSG